MRDHPGLPWGLKVIIRVLIRRRQEGQSQTRRCNNRSRGRGDVRKEPGARA